MQGALLVKCRLGGVGRGRIFPSLPAARDPSRRQPTVQNGCAPAEGFLQRVESLLHFR